MALYPINTEFKRIVFDLSRDVEIGRAKVSSPSLIEEEMFLEAAISRRHALLRQRSGRVYISDVGSSNGTFVNEVEVVDKEVELKSGYILRFGICKRLPENSRF